MTIEKFNINKMSHKAGNSKVIRASIVAFIARILFFDDAKCRLLKMSMLGYGIIDGAILTPEDNRITIRSNSGLYIDKTKIRKTKLDVTFFDSSSQIKF